MSNQQLLEPSSSVAKLRNGIWSFGVLSLLLEVINRSNASFADGYVSAVELLCLFTVSCLLMSWLYLKPEKSLSRSNIGALQRHQSALSPYQNEDYLRAAKARMLELQAQHMISQEYTLPFPYLCQIYHLLNLKHLENIHSFSLNNLKVIEVNRLQSTAIGGLIKFKTILDSPVNPLRIWRRPIVEVGLTLHSPYTVELNIPAYNNKSIIVIFNVLPISSREHKFFIDIYSDLAWPKPFLQVLLHCAACLTLFEDLPYLHTLAKRNVPHLLNLSGGSSHETVWLFRRFVDLYGSSTLSCSNPA